MVKVKQGSPPGTTTRSRSKSRTPGRRALLTSTTKAIVINKAIQKEKSPVRKGRGRPRSVSKRCSPTKKTTPASKKAIKSASVPKTPASPARSSESKSPDPRPTTPKQKVPQKKLIPKRKDTPKPKTQKSPPAKARTPTRDRAAKKPTQSSSPTVPLRRSSRSRDVPITITNRQPVMAGGSKDVEMLSQNDEEPSWFRRNCIIS